MTDAPHSTAAPRRPTRFERAAGPLAAATLVALLWPLVVGAAGPVGDASLFHLPYQMLVGDFARAGEPLLWNPWTNGGSPDGAEPQVGAFSPLAVGAGLLFGGTSAAFVLFWLATWCLSALGAARLVRHLGAPGWAQYALALAWCTNGAFVGHAGHTCFVYAFAFLPWSVWLLDRALDEDDARERLRLAACAGGWWGLSALAGYPGLVVVHAMVLAGWTLVRLLPGRADEPRRTSAGRGLGALGALVATGLVVLSPSYAAFFVEGAGFSARTGALTREIATGWGAEDPAAANPLELAGLFTLANPALAPAASDPEHDPFAITDPSSVGANAGAIVWLLALLTLARRARSPRDLALFAFGLLSLALALGHALPLRAWAYDLLPPLRYFRHTAFFRVGLLFALVVLAARGSRAIDAPRVRAFAFALTAVIAAVTYAALESLPELAGGLDASWFAVAPLLPLAVGLAARGGDPVRTERALAATCVLGAAFALVVGRPLVMQSPERRQALDARHDPSLVAGEAGFVRAPFAYTIPEARTQELLAGDTAALAPYFADPVANLFDSANLPGKESVLAGYTALNNERHHQLAAVAPLVEQALGRERVFTARRALFLPDDDATFEAFAAAAAGGAVPLVVHTSDEPATELGDDAAELIGEARLERTPFAVRRYEPRVLELELLRPSDEPAWLFTTERWAKGWSATAVDANGVERAVDVERAGFLWRAVRLEPGDGVVRFTYTPFGWPWLPVLSWGTLAALVAVSVASARRRSGRDAILDA